MLCLIVYLALQIEFRQPQRVPDTILQVSLRSNGCFQHEFLRVTGNTPTLFIRGIVGELEVGDLGAARFHCAFHQSTSTIDGPSSAGSFGGWDRTAWERSGRTSLVVLFCPGPCGDNRSCIADLPAGVRVMHDHERPIGPGGHLASGGRTSEPKHAPPGTASEPLALAFAPWGRLRS